jgi:hypothetical protein
LPCIIVTPSSPTEYHIAFHHKDSPLMHVSFAAQQKKLLKEHDRQQTPQVRRAFLNALGPFVDTPPPLPQVFDVNPPIRRFPMKPRIRTAILLSIPIFIVACHLLVTTLIRNVGLRSFFGGGFSRGGFSSAAAHVRAQRDSSPEPGPASPLVQSLDDQVVSNPEDLQQAEPEIIQKLEQVD